MQIEIDKHSGFCFGVVNAIQKAEEQLQSGETLYCLGDIVHNSTEVARLEQSGLVTISHSELDRLSNKIILFRAHGEPPETYKRAGLRSNRLIDATCPVVLKLQANIKYCYDKIRTTDAQIVIFGKIGHAEVNGLIGQTDGTAIVIESIDDLHRIDFSRPIYLFSQTTQSIDRFDQLVETIQDRILSPAQFHFKDTICRQVSNRIPQLSLFSKQYDLILFVSGKKSSNGKVLYETCQEANPQTYFISDISEIHNNWFTGCSSIGICGATSTPRWLMENIKLYLEQIL